MQDLELLCFQELGCTQRRAASEVPVDLPENKSQSSLMTEGYDGET
jgi:hypothetical protein